MKSNTHCLLKYTQRHTCKPFIAIFIAISKPMRILASLFFSLLTIALIIVLNTQLDVGGNKTPRLGFFLSPQTGFWQNAEDADLDFSTQIHGGLKGNAEVYLDERLVPHVFTENEEDAYYIQGYLHAKFRLWQMEFQTYAAGGRLSEIMGDSASGTNFLKIDKFFRRLGMVYGAENSLEAMKEDPQTWQACNAYTAGINAYINALKEKDLPLEYKMLNYKPEPWTNFKSALFLKYMSWDLAGYEEDFERTNAMTVFTQEQYSKLFPHMADSTRAVIPRSYPLPVSKFSVTIPDGLDSNYFKFLTPVEPANKALKPEKLYGSNNWAVDGTKTKSGKPILCNDPHLGLNLPAIWFEMQISTPNFNAYGASFPGSPSVIIGFNDSCAWGFTNAGRDVKDYYEITFKDSTMQEYYFDSAWIKTGWRNEIIKIRNKADDTIHLPMTVFGPVMYDRTYPNNLNNNKAYAVRWMAHEKSNELKTFYLLNHAKNFDDYEQAISFYKCPGQNMIFAAKNGDIAIRQQGNFPAKWKQQGDFVMPGKDSTYMWQGSIPDSLNITMLNPQRGFVSSANQSPYDLATYPYYVNGNFALYRGWMINRELSNMQQITVEDMGSLQNNNYNLRAESARPVFIKYINKNLLDNDEQGYYNIVTSWNLQNDAREKGATIFEIWLDSVMTTMYADEFSRSNLKMPWPEVSTMIEGIAKDSLYEFADNINTAEKENISDVITAAFKKTCTKLKSLPADEMEWGSYKDGGVRHLLKLEPFSRMHLKGGGGYEIINAFKKTAGPSWRMIVELTDETNARGVYPGGQSGNPGSKYYDNFIDDWLAGKYYVLHLYKRDEMEKKKDLKGILTFSKS